MLTSKGFSLITTNKEGEHVGNIKLDTDGLRFSNSGESGMAKIQFLEGTSNVALASIYVTNATLGSKEAKALRFNGPTILDKDTYIYNGQYYYKLSALLNLPT